MILQPKMFAVLSLFLLCNSRTGVRGRQHYSWLVYNIPSAHIQLSSSYTIGEPSQKSGFRNDAHKNGL